MNEWLVVLSLAGRIPMGLTTVAELAEHLYDAESYAAASHLLPRLDAALAKLAADLPANALQAPLEALAGAKRAFVRDDMSQIRVEANRLCAWAVDRLAAYLPLRVIGPQQLDVHLREVQIAARAGSVALAVHPLAEARKCWKALAQLPTLGTSPARLTFDRQLDAVEQSISTGDIHLLQAATAEAIEGVDAVESVLTGAASLGGT